MSHVAAHGIHELTNDQFCKKLSGVFCHPSGVFCRPSGVFSRPSHLGVGQGSVMLQISLPSRCFSSETLMEGERVVRDHTYDNWNEAELLAELHHLEAGSWIEGMVQSSYQHKQLE